MRIATNTMITVMADGVNSIPKAFLAVRKLDAQLSIAEFQSRIKNGSNLIEIPTYRNDLTQYLDCLKLSHAALNELTKNLVGLRLSDSESNKLEIGDIEETLAFHQSYQPKDLVSHFSNEIAAFRNADWLAKTGEAVDKPGTTCVDRPSNGQTNWTYLQVAIQSQIVRHLVEQEGHHHCCLHPHYDQLMPAIKDLVTAKLRSAPPGFFDEHNDPSGLIILSLIERYFSYSLNNSITASWVEWLLHGHIPCGWEGEYPEGNLLIW